MRLVILIVLDFVLYGCAAAEQGKRIIPDEVTWIEKGRTTRAEVVARFGLPPVEFPQSSGFTTASTTTITTQRPTRLRKATYVYTRRDTADGFPFFDNPQFRQCQFWVVYDEQVVVRDYGFLGDSCGVQMQDKGLHVAAH